MTVIRWMNAISGALLVIGALAFLLFLPGNVAEYAGEPEDVWLGGFWVALLGLVATLCFTNAAGSATPPRWRVVANLVVVMLMTVLLVVAGDPAAVLLVPFIALGPLATLFDEWRTSRVQRS